MDEKDRPKEPSEVPIEEPEDWDPNPEEVNVGEYIQGDTDDSEEDLRKAELDAERYGILGRYGKNISEMPENIREIPERLKGLQTAVCIGIFGILGAMAAYYWWPEIKEFYQSMRTRTEQITTMQNGFPDLKDYTKEK